MRHRQRHVPVTMGSPRFRTLEASGAFDSEIVHRTLDCPPASAWVEPLGERHANRIGRDGAHVIVLQPDASAFDAFSNYLSAVRHLRRAEIAADAWRLARELDAGD